MPVYWIALSLLIIAVDHLTDPYIRFPILFLLPVTLASVYNGRLWGVGLALSMPVIRCYFEIMIVPWAVPNAAPSSAHRRSMKPIQSCCHSSVDDESPVSSGSH